MSTGTYQPNQNQRPQSGGQRTSQYSAPLSPSPVIVEEVKKYQQFEEFPADKLVDYADKLGKYLRDSGIKTSQIRKFLDAVNRIRAEVNANTFTNEPVILLKPKLAYATGREKKIEPLLAVLSPCIDRTKTYKDFQKLVRFIESIVAYHKYYGGTD